MSDFAHFVFLVPLDEHQHQCRRNRQRGPYQPSRPTDLRRAGGPPACREFGSKHAERSHPSTFSRGSDRSVPESDFISANRLPSCWIALQPSFDSRAFLGRELAIDIGTQQFVVKSRVVLDSGINRLSLAKALPIQSIACVLAFARDPPQLQQRCISKRSLSCSLAGRAGCGPCPQVIPESRRWLRSCNLPFRAIPVSGDVLR